MNEIQKYRIEQIEKVEKLLTEAHKILDSLQYALIEEKRKGKMRVEEITPLLEDIVREQKDKLDTMRARLRYVKEHI